MLNILIGAAALGAEIVRILSAVGIIAAAPERGRSVVDRLAEGVRQQERVAVRKPLVRLELKRIVDRIQAVLADNQRAETLEGTARLNGTGAGRGAVNIVRPRQLSPLVADVGQLDHQVARDLPLNGQVELLYVRIAAVEIETAHR